MPFDICTPGHFELIMRVSPWIQYLDNVTIHLLYYLVIGKGQFGIEGYIKNAIGGEQDVIYPNMLRLEAALKEDVQLMNLQVTGLEIFKRNPKAAYEQYRLQQGDMKRSIDWEAVERQLQEDKDNEVNK